MSELLYTIERHEHGILVTGPGGIPINEFGQVAEFGKSLGYKLVDAGIASALGATLAIVSDKSAALWSAEIAANLKGGDRELAWVKGTDTGSSSLTIFSVLTKHQGVGSGALGNRADIPYDPSDFGRCFRLLELFPKWRTRMHLVGAKYPKWKPFTDNWPELEALWNEESKSPDGMARKLYARLQELRKANP